MKRLFLFLAMLIAMPAFAQRTFYIDYTGGSNSNTVTQAQSKVTPWKTWPGAAAGCTGGTAISGYTYQTGDDFVFKGNVEWVAACFPLNISNGGSSGSGLTQWGGLDATWFTDVNLTITSITRASNVVTLTATGAHKFVPGGSVTVSGVTDASFDGTFTLKTISECRIEGRSECPTSGLNQTITYAQTGSNGSSSAGTVNGFTRPRFNMGGSELSPNNRTIVFQNNYIRVTGIEFVGLHWTGAVAWQQDVHIVLGSATNSSIDGNYFHGWTHVTGGGTGDAQCVVIGDTHYPNDGVGSSYYNNIADGFDTDKVSCANGVFGGPPTIYNNIFRNSAGGYIQNGPIRFSGNIVHHMYRSFMASMHGNAYESNCDDNFDFYDNWLFNTDEVGAGSTAAAGVNIIISPISGKTTKAWNNLTYNTPAGNVFGMDGPSACGGATSGGTIYIYNNTVWCGTSASATQACFGNNTSSGIRTFVIKNNHMITTDSDGFTTACSGTCSASNNLVQTSAAAATDGYSQSTTPALKVTAITGDTVGAGADVSATVSGTTADYVLTVRPQDTTWDIGFTEWEVAGGGTCVITLSGSSIAFGNQIINTSSATQAITVQNTGTGTCNITDVTDDSDQFTTTTNCGSTLATTASCTVTIAFAPTSLGAKSGTVTVNDDDGGADTIGVTGTGIVAPATPNPVGVPVIVPPDVEAPKVAVKCPARAKSSLTCDLLSLTDNVGVENVAMRFGSWTEMLLPSQCAIKKRSWSFDVSKMARGVVAFSALASDKAGNQMLALASIDLY